MHDVEKRKKHITTKSIKQIQRIAKWQDWTVKISLGILFSGGRAIFMSNLSIGDNFLDTILSRSLWNSIWFNSLTEISKLALER